jgi:hypothetical protein
MPGRKNTITLSQTELQAMYSELGSTQAVANRLGVSRQTVARHLKRVGISIVGEPETKFFATKAELAEVYTELGLGKTAEFFGVNKALIGRKLLQFEIPRGREGSLHSLQVEHRFTARAVQSAYTKLGGMREAAEFLGTTEIMLRLLMRRYHVLVKPREKSEVWYSGDGYRHLLRPDHPNANQHGYVKEHRLVVELDLGRRLTDSEVVHHKDRDRLNNSLDNLEVLTQAEHARLHSVDRWTKHYEDIVSTA